MGEKSDIQWTDHTFNIAWGCTKVSPACDHCYAETWAKRMGLKVWGQDAERRTLGEKYWRAPLGWNARAEKAGRVDLVFCSSMADVFEDHPTLETERAKLWPLILVTPWLRWMLLTKRPENIARMTESAAAQSAIRRCWVGVTAETQEYYDLRWPILARVPALRHFVSNEPALGPLTRLRDAVGSLPHWVIVGGESGAGARPFDVSWASDVVRLCRAASISPFVKQLGAKPHRGGVPIALADKHGGDVTEWPGGVARDREWPADPMGVVGALRV